MSMGSVRDVEIASNKTREYGHSVDDLFAKLNKTTKPASKLAIFIQNIRRGKLGAIERRVRSHWLFTLLIVAAMLYAVFMDDVRNAAIDKDHDNTIDVVFVACFCVFAIDILASMVFERGYAMSILFFLDIIATGSMLVTPLVGDRLDTNNTKGLALARIARFVRIMRVMRVARFAMASTDAAMQQAQRKRQTARDMLKRARKAHNSAGVVRRNSFLGLNKFRDPAVDRNSVNLTPEVPSVSAGGGPKLARSISRSAVKKMSALASMTQAAAQRSNTPISDRSMMATALMQHTAEKIILLVLVLVVGIQLITFSIPDRTAENGLKLLQEMFPVYNASGCFSPEQAQYTSMCVISPCCEDWSNLLAQFDPALKFDTFKMPMRQLRMFDVTFLEDSVSNLRAGDLLEYDIGSTNSRIAVDTHSIVALQSVLSICQALVILLILLIFPYLFGRDVLQLVISPLELIFDRVQSIAQNPFSSLETSEKHKLIKLHNKAYELEMIGEALNRLTKLLQIGLGQAGTDIIAQNLQSGSFSVLQAGKRIDAIFAFCDIREFSACCEVMQEDCVVFVNTIADVVARAVTRSKGSINKNLGDAFLSVWKWSEGNGRSSLPMNKGVFESAEACLKASLSIIASVESSNLIQSYAWRQDMQQRLGGDFKITMGFGLHAGWAIEGAVGSEHKIDATYLSATVNLAARLESATRQYGVSLLMSHWFYLFLSETTKERCRRVDCVAVKGTTEPMTIIAFEGQIMGQQRAKQGNEYYELYIAGKWAECKQRMQDFLSQWPKDGPCLAVMAFMEQTDFVPPQDWQGFRKLTGK